MALRCLPTKGIERMHDDDCTDQSEPIYIRRGRGDTRTPIGIVCYQSGNPVDLDGLTVKFAADYANGENLVEATEEGVTVHPPYVCTAEPSTSRLIHNGTPTKKNDQIRFTTTETMPPGLSTGVNYFVTDKRVNSFKVALDPVGPPVTFTAGSGTLSYFVVGSAQWQPTDEAMETAGKYPCWFIVFDAEGRPDHFPVGKNMFLVIEEGN